LTRKNSSSDSSRRAIEKSTSVDLPVKTIKRFNIYVNFIEFNNANWVLCKIGYWRDRRKVKDDGVMVMEMTGGEETY